MSSPKRSGDKGGKESAGWTYLEFAFRKAPRLPELVGHRNHVQVLQVLATYANPRGEAWPSNRTIAENCGLTVKDDGQNSSVSASTRYLRRIGLLEVVAPGGGRKSTRYRLVIPSAITEVCPSASTEQNYHENYHAPDAGDSISLTGSSSQNVHHKRFGSPQLQKDLPPARKVEQTEGSHPRTDEEWGAAFEQARRAAA